jgi:hypothetical protein
LLGEFLEHGVMRAAHIKHVVQERHRRVDRALPSAIEINRDSYLRFLRLSLDMAFSCCIEGVSSADTHRFM